MCRQRWGGSRGEPGGLGRTAPPSHQCCRGEASAGRGAHGGQHNPWVCFLWDSGKTCGVLLRGNVRDEGNGGKIHSSFP